MKWYHYIAAFFAGAFLCNGIPHFIHGVSGDAFPTPFANPPGRGLSAAYINIVWGFFNLVAGYLLYRVAKISAGEKIGIAVLFFGALVMGVMLSIYFAGHMVY